MKSGPAFISLYSFLLVALCVTPSSPELEAKALPRAVHKKSWVRSSPTEADPAYCSALASANRFLQAWQSHDAEAGVIMLSDQAKGRISEDQLRAFFSAAPGAAFEITRGKRLAEGEYSFPVTLFGGDGLRPHHTGIVIRRMAQDDWVVEVIP